MYLMVHSYAPHVIILLSQPSINPLFPRVTIYCPSSSVGMSHLGMLRLPGEELRAEPSDTHRANQLRSLSRTSPLYAINLAGPSSTFFSLPHFSHIPILASYVNFIFYYSFKNNPHSVSKRFVGKALFQVTGVPHPIALWSRTLNFEADHHLFILIR